MIRIGSDPEFVIVSTARLKATEFTSNCNAPLVSVPTLFGAAQGTKYKVHAAGTDGHAMTGELRAAASYCPYLHVNYIKASFIEFLYRLSIHATKMKKTANFNEEFFNNFVLKAGPIIGSKPLGGHVHLTNFQNTAEITAVQVALLSVVAPILTIVEGSAGEVRRNYIFQGKHYGKWDNFRTDKGPGYIEWKAPSSWLVSPSIAQGVLALCYVVATNLPLVIEICKAHKLTPCIIPGTYKDRLALAERCVEALSKKAFMTAAGVYWNTIKNLMSIAMAYREWPYQKDICETWELKQGVELMSEELNLDKKHRITRSYLNYAPSTTTAKTDVLVEICDIVNSALVPFAPIMTRLEFKPCLKLRYASRMKAFSSPEIRTTRTVGLKLPFTHLPIFDTWGTTYASNGQSRDNWSSSWLRSHGADDTDTPPKPFLYIGNSIKAEHTKIVAEAIAKYLLLSAGLPYGV